MAIARHFPSHQLVSVEGHKTLSEPKPSKYECRRHTVTHMQLYFLLQYNLTKNLPHSWNPKEKGPLFLGTTSDYFNGLEWMGGSGAKMTPYPFRDSWFLSM